MDPSLLPKQVDEFEDKLIRDGQAGWAMLPTKAISGACSSPTVCAGDLLNSRSTVPFDGKQLLFFYDCETTGPSHYEEHIIEIASEVIVPDDLSSITKTEFSTLCHTSRPINPMATQAHGITAKMLVGKPPFATVFTDLLEWIKQCVGEACCNNEIYYPVLVAHNGFAFDYLFLMAEIKRHNLEESFIGINSLDLWFADTMYDARRLIKAADPIFDNWSRLERRRLGLENLFYRCFPQKSYQGHRAMADVQNMKQVFTTKLLKPILTNLTLKTKEEVWQKSCKKWSDRRTSQPYIAKMGKMCSVKLALCLHKNDITYEQLCTSSKTSSPEEFEEWLKGAGVRLKIWRNKIQSHFFPIEGSPIYIE